MTSSDFTPNNSKRSNKNLVLAMVVGTCLLILSIIKVEQDFTGFHKKKGLVARIIKALNAKHEIDYSTGVLLIMNK